MVWILSHRLKKEVIGMSWYKNHLTSGQMAFALSRVLTQEKMSLTQLVRAAKRHMSFLNMMRKGHLKFDTRMRMFWDYIGDLYKNDDVVEFVFMRGKHDTVSGPALRLVLSFVCFMLTESGLTIDEYVHCFFEHEECTVRLEQIDSKSFAPDCYDIYKIFESFLPFIDTVLKEKKSIDLWDTLCAYVPAEYL